ncbi:MAG: isoleucine--tRNA ligase [Myxococcota bacterium]
MSPKKSNSPYPDVDPRPRFPEIEREILSFWRRERIFEASVEQRPAGHKGSNEYVFYDGPPFANGLPHYGHLLTGYVKDVIPRYQTLRGRRVERRFGWDCHGLPAEMEAEKELSVSGRTAITEYGIDRFNDHCRRSVYRYTEAWQEYVTRQARWVDFKNGYKTLDLPYMESVIWAFKRLWDRGLVYEAFRVMPYSWACQTPLSNFETRQDDALRERQDPAITVRFELVPEAGDDGPLDLLAWTTTPWTLPSNLALAVGPEIDYAVLEQDGRRVVLGEATLAKYEAELGGARRVGSVRGERLVGRRYRPLFPFFDGTENAFRVLGGSFVDTEEGTGIVHMAPGFGEEDMEACREAEIPAVVPVDDAGRFTSEVPLWEGQLVLDANPDIIRELKAGGRILRHDTIVHNYPHCWRTDEPLIYRAVNSWYVRVSELRDRMVALNQEIRWIPAHVRDGLFGKWLEGARDWSISRNRFWGSPIPVWRSDDPRYPRLDAYGSLDELERDFGVRPDDLHRPAIDALVRPNPDDPTGQSSMRRVPEVLDCWFESGSMPYAQVHYPFENREWFEDHFPADFIVEYLAQTRGWFYTMMVLATALFDKPPFRNGMCHGVILADRGRKLSKRLKNFPAPEEIFETHGSDALRWYLISSPVLKGGELRIDPDGRGIAEVVKSVLHPLWNAYHFFCLYAKTDNVRAELRFDAEGSLDRYILAKARRLVEECTRLLDDYDLPGACGRVTAFTGALTNWYIRRSRERFWKAEADDDKRDAYDTLYTVLVLLCRVASPLLPLVTEAIHRGLTAEKSVHLLDWPDPGLLPADPELVMTMDRVRAVCSVARTLRESHQVRVRQPLPSLTVAGPGVALLTPHLELLREEVNVKDVILREEIDDLATLRLQLNARILGPRLGPEMKPVLAAARRGEFEQPDDGRVRVAGQLLEPGEFELRLDVREGIAAQALPGGEAVVLLDLQLSDELVQEGLARDLVRAVQQVRKEAGLHVSDRIRLALSLPEDFEQAALRFRDYLSEQTLAVELHLGGPLEGDAFEQDVKLAGAPGRIALARA